MTTPLPKYVVIFDDLKELGIVQYFKSREFRFLMNKNDLLGAWVSATEQIPKPRGYRFPDFDKDGHDSLGAFALLFNTLRPNPKTPLKNDPGIEKIITIIIVGFIDFNQYKLDFKLFMESLEQVGFSEKNREEILLKIEENSKKSEKPPVEEGIDKVKLNHIVRIKSKVFIVHGHNEGLKQSVARFLEKLKVTPIIISEQPSGGKTIIEQIESQGDVDFAVVLMTADDEGRKKGEEELNRRARQNVILELGYFFGKLGRKHVLVIYENGVEMPSDFLGILHVSYDSGEAWKMKLARELKNSGFEVDLNQVF